MRIPVLACLVLGLLSSCSSAAEVTRRRGDIVQSGRKVSPVAYAWYARGRHHESVDEFSRAEHDYRAALQHDFNSGSTWAALGRVTCRSGWEPAQQIFDRGLRKSDRKAPIFYERGLCRLAHAKRERSQALAACEDLRAAMRLEPEKRDLSEGYASCLEATDQRRESSRVRRAARLYMGSRLSTPKAPTVEKVDRALRQGDLAAAQEKALTLMSPGTLAVRATLLGKPQLAKEQAQLVLDASPTDPDATVTMIALRQHDGALPTTLDGLSDVGVLLLVQILKRHVSTEQSAHFFNQYRQRLTESKDPLVQDTLPQWEPARDRAPD